MKMFRVVFSAMVLLFAVSVGHADIIINEIMQNPGAVGDSDGEWFELFNDGETDVDINGWIISDNGSDSHTIDFGGSLLVPAGGYLVLGLNSAPSTNGGVNVDYQYSGISLGNSDDEIVLTNSLGQEVDRVEYDGGPGYPDPNGASMYLIDPTADNNDGSNWSSSTEPWEGSAGDYGTPGASNVIEMPTTLRDGGFEVWAGDADLTEWNEDLGAGTTLAQETTMMHEGTYSAAVTWTSTESNSIEQNIYSPVESETYRYNAWVYDNDPEGYVDLSLIFRDNQGSQLGYAASEPSIDSDGWQFLSVLLEASVGSVTGRVYNRFEDSEAWVDGAEAYIDDASYGIFYTIDRVQNELTDDAVVMIEGIVTSPNGVQSTTRTDMYIQDESGYGIQLYDGNPALGDDLVRGDRVFVYGVRDSYYDATEIVNFDVVLLSSGNELPEAHAFTTGDFAASGIDWEGSWAVMTGTLQNDPGTGSSYSLIINDGTGDATVRVYATNTGIDLSGYGIGDELTFYGNIDTYSGAPQLVPAAPEDVVEVQGPEVTAGVEINGFIEYAALDDIVVDENNVAGLDAEATDGYDSGIDVPKPGHAPSNYLYIYFPHAEWGVGADNFMHDIRNGNDDLADDVKIWDFNVDTDLVGELVELEFCISDLLPDNYNVYLYDPADGTLQDLRENSFFSFTATADERSFELHIGDSTDPVVTIATPQAGTTLNVSTPYTLDWSIEETSTVAEVLVEISYDDGATWETIGEFDEETLTVEYTTPAFPFYSQYCWLMVTVTDYYGNSSDDIVDFTIGTHGLQFSGIDNNWILVNIPLELEDNSLEAIIGDDLGELAYFVYDYSDQTGYSLVETNEFGNGYWLFIEEYEDIVLDMFGTPPTGPVEWPLSLGWNITGISMPVFMPEYPVESLQFSDGTTTVYYADAVTNGWISAAVYGWNTGNDSYYIPETIGAGEGYWFNATQENITLVVEQPLGAELTLDELDEGDELDDENDWFVGITASQNDHADVLGGFGVNLDASYDYDAWYDLPVPPISPVATMYG